MTRHEFRNAWCILRNIDPHEIPRDVVPDFPWAEFQRDPHSFLITTDDAIADAIWDVVERRMK